MLFQCSLDIVGRPAVGTAVFGAALVDLGKRALDKRRRASQDTAPGRLRLIAVEMPAIFPVPTLDAVDTISAWKEDSPLSSDPGCATTRIDSGKRRNCTNRVLIEK